MTNLILKRIIIYDIDIYIYTNYLVKKTALIKGNDRFDSFDELNLYKLKLVWTFYKFEKEYGKTALILLSIRFLEKLQNLCKIYKRFKLIKQISHFMNPSKFII